MVTGGGVVEEEMWRWSESESHLDSDHRHRRNQPGCKNRQNVLRSSGLPLFQIRRKGWRKVLRCRRTLLRRRSAEPDIHRRVVFLYVPFTARLRSQIV